ncbi:MAG: amino acid ABC transporter substrate-binding protein, partial [Xanthobacteraceae bacterium]
MKSAIGIIAAACLLVGAEAPAAAEDLEGTLKKIKETGGITIGYRESSLP